MKAIKTLNVLCDAVSSLSHITGLIGDMHIDGSNPSNKETLCIHYSMDVLRELFVSLPDDAMKRFSDEDVAIIGNLYPSVFYKDDNEIDVQKLRDDVHKAHTAIYNEYHDVQKLMSLFND